MNNVVYLEYKNKLLGNIILEEENLALNFNKIKARMHNLTVNEIISKCALKIMANKYFHIYNSLLENISEINLLEIYDSRLKNDLLAAKILNIFVDILIEVIENIHFFLKIDCFYIKFNLGKKDKNMIEIIQKRFLEKKMPLKILSGV